MSNPPPSMRVLCIANRKGGGGKTTLATHLAVEAERAGAGPVGVIDLDPMQGMAMWWDRRVSASPILAQTTLDLGTALAQLRASGCWLVVLDTPAAADVGEAIGAADLVLIPVQPSPDDLAAVGITVQAVHGARRPMVFVLNRTKPGVRLTGEAVVSLSRHGTVAPIMVADRMQYAGAKVDGRTAPELDPTGLAAREIAKLWTYVNLHLHEGQSMERLTPLGTIAEESADLVRKGDAVANAALLPPIAKMARPHRTQFASPLETPPSRAGDTLRPSLSHFDYRVFEKRKRRSGIGMVPVGLNLDPEMHHRLRCLAFELDMPIRAIIQIMLVYFMEEYKSR